LIGLTCLTTNGRPPVTPKLDRRRAVFVLSKIDEILGWEKTQGQERDSRFVDLGRYLCEVRSGQYWRLDNLRSFDEFLEKKFPESRRKALLPDGHSGKLAKVARRDQQKFDCAPWVCTRRNCRGKSSGGKWSDN
jgi:hypothetical protein